MPELLMDKISEFLLWLDENTDYGDWHPTIKEEVHKKLVEILISDKVKN